ncbi:ABC transporter substrate-binding protein [Pseudarthrobacter sulfonivorans]|uniref:substrate-binding periplasmic protein n=1 Tax=Pseudarthrobacter sulfonivorans TaxID=121292 RepID=UPI00286244A8|nr:ABC transporter substrate-binding protein [Pseudarthrobacter sulfonivorans]MDR6414481.1 polar amino acid transport system substrate-binding protein [Pseudarthrobacter sulfonivorans]
MNKTKLTAVMFAAALPLAACGTAGTAATVAADCKPVVSGVETASEGKLTMAVAEYPPYVSMKGGSLSGVDGEVLKRVAKDLCLEPDAKTSSFTAIIESVKNGSVDLSAGNWYINEERGQQFAVSEPVYLDKMALLTSSGAETIDDVAGGTVGTPQGYLWVGDLQEAVGTDKVKLYATEDAVYQDVKSGRAGAGVMTYGAALQLVKSNNDSKLKVTELKPDDRIQASVGAAKTAVLVNKGKTTLRDAVNQIVENMRQDGSLQKALEDNGLPGTAADIKAAAGS